MKKLKEMSNVDKLSLILIKEHKKRNDVIYSLVDEFRTIIKKITEEDEDNKPELDLLDDDHEESINAHILGSISSSIKDLLQVGIKNDELVVKMVEMFKKDQTEKIKKGIPIEHDQDDESGDNPFENELMELLK